MKRPRDSKSPFRAAQGQIKSENPDSLPPVFSFEHMRPNSGYSISCCENDDQAAFSRKLFMLSQMLWRDIIGAPRHGLGTEKIARSSLKVPIPASVTEDVTFLAIRFNALKPMIGFRDGRTFQVLFLDHNFSAYNHG